jgi:hypothetical protein
MGHGERRRRFAERAEPKPVVPAADPSLSEDAIPSLREYGCWEQQSRKPV